MSVGWKLSVMRWPAMPTEDNGLLRLATGRNADDQPFLQPHHLLAAARLERLIERARLAPRVTMSYDPGRTGGGGQDGNLAAEITDTAAAARQKLNQLAAAIPQECWGVLIDVCGFAKGLQTIETERRWPRRSAKLVLRIGLDQLALLLGISAQAVGRQNTAIQAWLPERLPIIADSQT